MTTTSITDLDQHTIRCLCMDMIQSANSGHPGTPMGIAPVGYALWNDVLRFDPTDPPWPNGDRFVLSVGHASTLLWSLLHLAEVRAVDEDYACDIRDASHCDLQHAPAPDLFRNAAVRKRSSALHAPARSARPAFPEHSV